MPLGASKPSLSYYLGLIRTIEGEHAGYLTRTVFRTKLLLLGETALCLACLSARVQGGFEMHIHERCRLGGESGGVLEANLGLVGEWRRTKENREEGRRRT